MKANKHKTTKHTVHVFTWVNGALERVTHRHNSYKESTDFVKRWPCHVAKIYDEEGNMVYEYNKEPLPQGVYA